MMRWLLLLALPGTLLTGCLNPYMGDFSCPKTANGKCVSVEDAYNESRGNPFELLPGTHSEIYQDALFERMAGLLNEPETPMVVPPKVMRVLVLPYEGQDEELYLNRYAYLFTDRPRWILTNPLKTPMGDQ